MSNECLISRFNGFRQTVKTVLWSLSLSNTTLKRGVNENCLIAPKRVFHFIHSSVKVQVLFWPADCCLWHL